VPVLALRVAVLVLVLVGVLGPVGVLGMVAVLVLVLVAVLVCGRGVMLELGLVGVLGLVAVLALGAAPVRSQGHGGRRRPEQGLPVRRWCVLGGAFRRVAWLGPRPERGHVPGGTRHLPENSDATWSGRAWRPIPRR
jgi:hypothetical protein